MGEVVERSSVDALEAVYRTHFDRLVGLARVLVDDRDATEVVQEAFVRVLSRWEDVHDREDPYRYVRSAVLNTARSRLRHRRVRRRHEPEPGAGDGGEVMRARERDPSDRVVVLDAIRSLPRRQRECIALRYYADLTGPDIATCLGISEGAVRSHLSRALDTIKATLEEAR